METKALLFGIIGFLLGGLVVSVAATQTNKDPHSEDMGMTMSQMTENLQDKRGDAYDDAFITAMIEYHQGAIDMAELSAERANHEEIKQLSREIIEAQRTEVSKMEQWRKDWGLHGETAH
jgi:uncharacterized protein (DUF305 family)